MSLLQAWMRLLSTLCSWVPKISQSGDSIIAGQPTLVLACLQGWKMFFPSSSWDLASCNLHLLPLALCSPQRSGFLHLLCSPFLGSARLLSAPSQPSLPSLSRSCSLSLFLHIVGSRPWILLVPLHFVKMCHVLGAKTGHSTLDVNSQVRERITLLDQLALPLPVQPSVWLLFLEALRQGCSADPL